MKLNPKFPILNITNENPKDIEIIKNFNGDYNRWDVKVRLKKSFLDKEAELKVLKNDIKQSLRNRNI